MVATKIQLLVAIGVAVSIVQAGPIGYNGNKPSFNNKATCTTPQCRLTAAGILADIDPFVDPCQDFSKFTCGGFNQKYEIPSDATSISRRELVQQNNDRIVRSIVDVSLGISPKPARGDVAAQRNIKKLQDLFNSCMDEAAILKVGRKPLADEIQKIVKSFSAPGSLADKTTLSKTLGYFHRLGLSIPSFFFPYIGNEKSDPLVKVLSIYTNGVNMDMGEVAEFYQNPELVKKYQDTAAIMLQIILGDEDVANRTQSLAAKDVKKEWTDAAKDVVDFELQLADILSSPQDASDPVNYMTPRTIEQLSTLTPSVDWALMLQETIPSGVNYTRPIIVFWVPQLTKIDALLQKTPSSTLRHYFSWLLIQNHADKLAGPYKQPLLDWNNVVWGDPLDIKVGSWETCISLVNTNLNHLVGHYFIKETFKGNSRKEVMATIDNIIATYEKNFNTTAWLDKTTRDGAIKKLRSIAFAIGYSTHDPDGASSKSLDTFYKTYPITANDYFGNQFNYYAWSATLSYSQLLQPVNREEMYEHVSSEAASNRFWYNMISIPAGMLQDPVFNLENPEYLNYGSAGVIAAHEMGHAFDNIGREYDHIGGNTVWWTDATTQTFKEKAQCLVEQYGNFTVKGPDNKDYNLNGKRTLSENMSDNTGLKMAFQTWQSRFKSDPNGRKIKNFKLPGLEKYTPEQLFFISIGRFWCSKMTPEALVQYTRSNPHSPPYWRTNGLAMNSPDFARVFSCPKGSPMNPEKKCAVW